MKWPKDWFYFLNTIRTTTRCYESDRRWLCSVGRHASVLINQKYNTVTIITGIKTVEGQLKATMAFGRLNFRARLFSRDIVFQRIANQLLKYVNIYILI